MLNTIVDADVRCDLNIKESSNCNEEDDKLLSRANFAKIKEGISLVTFALVYITRGLGLHAVVRTKGGVPADSCSQRPANAKLRTAVLA